MGVGDGEPIEMEIPEDHPRYLSLTSRERIADGVEAGLVDRTGLIAHGRGEAFDYLLGETTIPPAEMATKAAAAALVQADSSVISVNGNTAVLSGEEIASMSRIHDIPVEINIFHRTEGRVARLVDHMKGFGLDDVLGIDPDATIPNLAQPRAACCEVGIYNADVVLVPLEDGDRAQALKGMGKTVITIDLNPLSRTARTADITIVDNVVRAIPNIDEAMSEMSREEAQGILSAFDNGDNLKETMEFIARRMSAGDDR